MGYVPCIEGLIGATVTDLYADTNATVAGTESVLVAVIDNTTGATLLSCMLNLTDKSGCSNTSGSGSAEAGDNIEIELTATGSSCNNEEWRVRFRYQGQQSNPKQETAGRTASRLCLGRNFGRFSKSGRQDLSLQPPGPGCVRHPASRGALPRVGSGAW